MSLTYLTDEEVMSQIMQHDESAFAELHRRFAIILVNTAYQRMQDKDLAEEIVQDMFVAIWLKRDELPVLRSVRAYLFTMLRNRVIEQYRLQTRLMSMETIDIPESGVNTTEESLFYNDLMRAYECQLNRLPEKCRVVFDLHRQGKAVAEIAGQLHISPKTVESHLLKANRTLRDHLKDFALLMLLIGIQ